MAHVGLYILFFFSFLCEAVDAIYYCYTYYDYYLAYSTYNCYYYVPVGTIIGAVVGSVPVIVCIIGVIVFFCCIRRGRQATTGRVITNTGHMTFMSTNTRGYINTATYPPGTQIATAYPPGMPTSYRRIRTLSKQQDSRNNRLHPQAKASPLYLKKIFSRKSTSEAVIYVEK